MRIKPAKEFEKRFQKLPKKVKLAAIERLETFITDQQHPLLRDHALKGDKRGKRAFSVTGDYRVIYILEDEDTAVLLDIGKHAQVY